MNGTGIWIRQEILQFKLPLVQTAVLSMITEMQKPNFHASNKYIAETLNINIRSATRAITDLQTKGLINILGRTSARIITVANMSLDDYRQNVQSTIDRMSSTKDNMSKTIDNLSTNRKDNKNKKEDIILTPKQLERKEKEKELGKQAKACLIYYSQKHTEVRKFEPTIDWGRDMAIFKRFLKADYVVDAIEEVIDFFFEYKKRSNFSTRALYNSFDTLYGVLLDKAEGRR